MRSGNGLVPQEIVWDLSLSDSDDEISFRTVREPFEVVDVDEREAFALILVGTSDSSLA